MKRPVAVGAATLVTFLLGGTLAVLVAGSASAASPTTTGAQTTTGTMAPDTMPMTTTEGPADRFLVINGTANAASDHEIVASSAFPNYTSGAVDNYYSLAHSHVDNSPFAQGTASPFDTGPIGQTAAAGNTQQPQYADARWPGDGKAEYGSQGGPHAVATAGDFTATADASLASNALAGPSMAHGIVLPKGLDGRLRMAIAAWKATWLDRLSPTKPPALPKPQLPKPTLPKPTAPRPIVTTPVVTITTPNTSVGGVNAPPAPAPAPVQAPTPTPTVPTPTVPNPTASAPSRSLASDSTPTDGESLLSSSTRVTLVPGTGTAQTAMTQTATTQTATSQATTTKTAATKKKSTTTSKSKKKKKNRKTAKKTRTTKQAATPTQTAPDNTGTTKKPGAHKRYTLVTSGESSLGRVTLGGGQIVIHDIHVTASIANDGTPTYKAAVSVGSATIGGVPVTIDEDGVHVAGQGQALPYQQASDALNNALKQAGIRLFLVGPEVTTCGPSGGGTGSGTGTTTTTTTPSSTDQSGATDPSGACGQSSSTCDQTGAGTGTGLPTTTPATTTSSTDTTTTPSGACGQTTTCDQMGASGGTGTGTTSTTTTPSVTRPTTTTTTTTGESGTTPTPSSCDSAGMTTGAGLCSPAGTGSGTQTTAGSTPGSTLPPGSTDPLTFDFGASDAGEETVTATGVHVVFTQPVNQSGVPSQQIEHILGEVFVDSLATPAPDTTPSLDLSSAGFGASAGSGAASGGSCLGGGRSSGKTASGGGLTAGGSSSAAGSVSSSSLSPSVSGLASASQPVAGSTAGPSLPVAAALALRKPLWLLLAYLVWQGLVIGTGVSLWKWRRGDES